MCEGPNLTNAILFADSNRGQYIPQHFAQAIKRECVEGVTADDWAILDAGPDHEWYWETFDSVESNALVRDPESGISYRLYQDGDLWLVPEDDLQAA